jgi:hypothetical protein
VLLKQLSINVKHLKIMIKFAILNVIKVDFCLWIHYTDNSVSISNHASIEEAEEYLVEEKKHFDVYESKITPHTWY